ncbi:MAG: hypothetical protein J1E98_00350 [Lachnospiraceae bacterium]|nr:hypothetical protein [Lachnospiraceae bacterium]
MSKKVNLLKSIGVLCLVVSLSVSIVSPPVFASESMRSADTSTASKVVAYTSDEHTVEMEGFEEFCAQIMLGDTLQEGEERVLGTLNGEEFCVRVTDVTKSSPSTYASEEKASAVFTFYTKKIFGYQKDLLIVTAECTWIKGSKIVNFKCTYDRLVSDIYCSWNDNFTKATETLHNLGLDITYGGDSQLVIFFAGLSADRQKVNLTCSKDYEL